MGLAEIILIAVGLAMDAFAVSVSLGLSVKKVTLKELAIPGLYFGIFQALMPSIGYFSGILFVNRLGNIEHWIAFILLGIIGGKMIKDSLSKNSEENEYSFKFFKMLVLAIATSIDALAVGVTFAFFKVDIIMAVLIIGLITLLLSAAGVKIGNILGAKFKSRAEFFGGLVLIIIGLKILIEGLL
jgi:putative Mn2+ efflux pump MntP